MRKSEGKNSFAAMDSGAVREAVLRGLRQSGNATEGSFADDVRGFVHAVDWTEPWLKGPRPSVAASTRPR